MKPDQWTRVEAIFARALDLPQSERILLLDAECGSDATLRSEVESLLVEHDREPDFMQAPPRWLESRDPDADAAADLPERIGPYRLIRTLGRGGMGQVYLAERVAEQFTQRVALKVMRRGLDTDDLVARFRTERQILARLNHPNIARLFDVGATEAALPYFVMEYVQGVPLFDFCAGSRRSIDERLRLFQTVCSAVHHAHRSLIVHRDLKPGNILVTEDGTPKLLDFGIAKILDPDGAAELEHTRVDARLLTPQYAAPEQLRGDPVTTACDVYALGLLLYELLTGRPAHADAERHGGLERLIVEVDPVPPSTAVAATQPQLARQLRGDLDTIVLEALRKEPEARYPSALSLSDDIERYLTGFPIQARPASVRRRLGKFVARNRVPAAAAAALFTVLTASTVVTAYQGRRLREESARVARERDKALQVRGFLLEMFGATGADQPTGDTVTARQLLDRQATTLDQAYPDDPEMRAEMLNVLAEGYEKLGLMEQAEPLARQALGIRRQLFGSEHPDVVVSANMLGWVLRERGQLDEAETLLEEAVAVGRRVFPEPGDARLARALNDLGTVRDARGGLAEAADLYRESLAMRRRVLGEEHIGMAITTSNLSVVLYQQGALEDAVREAQAALDLFRKILGPDHQRTTIVQSNLATMESVQGDHEGAAREHRAILERRKRLFGPRHPSVPYSMTMLAGELMLSGQDAEAERLLLDALEIQREVLGPRNVHVASTLRVLGDLEARSGRTAEALAHYRAAEALTREIFGPDHENLVSLLARTARMHEVLHQQAEAMRAYRDAARIARLARGAHHALFLERQLGLVEFLLRQGLLDEASRQIENIDDAAAGMTEDLRRRVAAARSAIAAPTPGAIPAAR